MMPHQLPSDEVWVRRSLPSYELPIRTRRPPEEQQGATSRSPSQQRRHRRSQIATEPLQTVFQAAPQLALETSTPAIRMSEEFPAGAEATSRHVLELRDGTLVVLTTSTFVSTETLRVPQRSPDTIRGSPSSGGSGVDGSPSSGSIGVEGLVSSLVTASTTVRVFAPQGGPIRRVRVSTEMGVPLLDGEFEIDRSEVVVEEDEEDQ